MTSLNPVFTCGDQIAEAIKLHQGLSYQEAMKKAVTMLRLVGIPLPERRVHEYPHQLSGGMRQRVMIAMALSCNPKLLIADEPTTALDVTIQAQILEIMKKLKKELGMSIMLITHDLGVIAEMAERVVVMYAGNVVEESDVHSIFQNPLHPYTIGLLKSIPQLNKRQKRLHVIEGVVPNPLQMPQGCLFHPRCPYVTDICRKQPPSLAQIEAGHFTACWNYEQVKQKGTSLKQETIIINLPDDTYAKDNPLKEKPDTKLMEVQELKTYFPMKSGVLSRVKSYVKAVDGVSFYVCKGETLGLVGESGCGKTTTGKTIMRLIENSQGKIYFEGRNISSLKQEEVRKLRKEMQFVFQDPYSSLDPRMTVGQIIAEPLNIHRIASGAEKEKRVKELLEVVGLSAFHAKRYPHEFSGGQRQRIGVARALALNPKLIICDEPVSALDVSIQSQIINLLLDLQKEFGLTYIFIAHDLAVVKHVSSRVGVMYLGKIVEMSGTDEIFKNPLHPYTQALMSAIPIPDPNIKSDRIILEGDVPSPVSPPSGCRFHTRCRYAQPICKDKEPVFADNGGEHFVACHFV